MKNKIRLVCYLLLFELSSCGFVAGDTPYLTVIDGKFTPCVKGSSCVSSQANEASQKVDYISYSKSDINPQMAQKRLEEIIESMPGSKIHVKKNGYLHVVFTSKILGFKDDFQAYFPENKQIIHIMSARRVLNWDFSANRKRVYKINFIFTQK